MEFVLIWLIGAGITLAIAYAIIRSAVRAALSDHYKTVRYFEQTGVWLPADDSWRAPPRSANDMDVPKPALKWWQR